MTYLQEKFRLYRHAKPNPDTHSTMRVRIRVCMSAPFWLTWWNKSAWLIEPQLAFLIGLKKFKAKIKDKHSKILTAEKIGLMKNIIIVVPISPIKQVCHEKYLKDGLKFGAEAKSNPRHAKKVPFMCLSC